MVSIPIIAAILAKWTEWSEMLREMQMKQRVH